MPRSKVFLTLVIILLLVNAAFFLAWYGLGVRGKFRELLASKIGKAIKGELLIGELHFSDRQLLAEGISFATSDSSITVSAKRIRAEYNLLRFIGSGFKPTKLLREIEITQPVVHYTFIPKPKTHKAKKPFKIPDIAPYFSSLKIIDGSAIVDVKLPLKIVSKGNLHIKESFNHISLSVVNSKHSKISFTAQSSKSGKLSLIGILDKGRIRDTQAELEAFHPLLVSHPDITNLQTEISAVASLSQSATGAPFSYDVKTQIWGTQFLFAKQYAVKIPFLGAETDGKKLSAQLSRSTAGNSNLKAEVRINELGKNLKFEFAEADGTIDLAVIHPDLKGLVNFTAKGNGTIQEPTLTLEAKSSMLAFKQHTVNNMALSAEYADSLVTFKLPQASYQNQEISIDGSFIPQSMALIAHIITEPIDPNYASYTASAELDVHAEFLDKYPLIDAKLHRLSLTAGGADIRGLHGYVKLIPVSADHNYYIDAAFSGENGYSLAVVGDLMDRNLLLDATFNDLYIADIYHQATLQKLNPLASGTINAFMTGDDIYLRTNLDVGIEEPVRYHTKLDGVGSIDIRTMEAALNIDGLEGVLNDQVLDFGLSATLKNKILNVHGFKVNDILSLSGRVNLRDMEDMNFAVVLNDIASRDIISFYPEFDISIPEFSGLSLSADYNMDGLESVNADLSLATIDLISITPLGIELGVHGSVSDVNIYGEISSDHRKVISLSGLASLKPKINLAMQAVFDSVNIEETLVASPILGNIAGKAGIDIRDIKSKNMEMDVMADIRASNIVIEDITISSAIIKAKQTQNLLQVDSLYVVSDGLLTLQGSGAIDYNVMKNEIFEGTNKLQIKVDGELFTWLKNLTSYIEESKGYSSLNFVVGTQEDQFLFSEGNIEIRDGYMKLKDQSEPLENINIKGVFDKNRVIIERGHVKMGEGSLIFNNVFEADNSDHFMLGYIDLGILRLMVEEPGILINIPLLSPPRTLSNIIIKGRDSRYATIKGPFDQMKIAAEVQVANTSILFPPNTSNLLKLATSLRETTSRRSDAEPAPLPFTLDVMVTLGENISYVTYPTHLFIEEGGFLHLLYDGQAFSVKDANFTSQRGTIDIFGTVFQVENVDITMVESQDLLNVSGLFIKRAPDGTMITLTVATSPDLTKSFGERLEFTLTSDNPEDRSISQILSRLRYNQTADIDQETRGIPLQDEALSLISGNLDSSLLTPILSPVENYIRRKLKLDGFTISAGFIQNLYTQYSTDPNLLADYTNMDHLTSDIAQFSSSILLNNMSITMSKYLGRKLFLDYRLDLQEATDLQKKTKLMISHETTVRYMFPKRYRLGYTFKYVPQENGISHEIMLQRSFRFWGL